MASSPCDSTEMSVLTDITSLTSLSEDDDVNNDSIGLIRPDEDESAGDSKSDSTTEFVHDDSDQSKATTKLRLFFLSTGIFGMSFLTYLFGVAVIPAQVRALVGDEEKSLYLGVLLASGGVLAFSMSPLVGTFSDRLQSRFGKRTPFLAVSTGILCIVIFGMAASAPLPKACGQNNTMNTTDTCYISPGPKPLCHNTTECRLPKQTARYAIYFISYVIMSGAYAVMSVSWNGLVPDVTPQHLRGFGSGLNGMMTLLGYGLGALWNIFLTDIGIWPTYSVMALIVLTTSLLTIFGVKEGPSSPRANAIPLTAKYVFISFWRPLKNHNFRWVFLTRFFMQMGLSTIIGYLYYLFVDVIDLPKCMSPERATGFSLLPLLVVGGIAGAISGWLSDRIKRRRIFVAIGGFIMALITGGIVSWTRSSVTAFVSMTVLGIGFGLYVSVDFALLLDVLPDQSTRANDIAVWHQSLLLPQFLATPIAGVIIDKLQRVNCHAALGYRVVLGLTCFYYLLSGLFVFKIRNVR
ncbi:uncharacterized protein [Oscarella lobularis]|uniref:uncharacterized protein n=1 Tax=Oscarella lobularis TaxID=121494 RepID=UPI0033136C9A